MDEPQPNPDTTPQLGPDGKPLTYEETPMVETPSTAPSSPPQSKADPPLVESTPPPPPYPSFKPNMQPSPSQPPSAPRPSVPPPPPQRGSFLKTLGTLILFGLLFVVGIVLSSFLRQFLPTGFSLTNRGTNQEQNTDIVPFVTPEDTTGLGSGTTGSLTSWRSYQVINGLTRQPVPGISFQLPPDVLSPICDGSNCASQGTYLPGGTRFTVAARGPGQVLKDYRGAEVADLGGTLFTSKPTTIKERTGVEFTGGFNGRTVSGYAFSQMRGYMIDLDSTTSLEINHFTPTGITADFTADDALFEKIVATLSLSGGTNKGLQ